MSKQPKFVPNAEQVEALQKFAEKYGATWKHELHDQWLRAGEGGGYMSEPYGHLLQQLRNSGGPSWLLGYTLPKSTSSRARWEEAASAIFRAREVVMLAAALSATGLDATEEIKKAYREAVLLHNALNDHLKASQLKRDGPVREVEARVVPATRSALPG